MDNIAPRIHILLNKNPVPSIEHLLMNGLAKDPETPKQYRLFIILYNIAPDCQLKLSGMNLLLKISPPWAAGHRGISFTPAG